MKSTLQAGNFLKLISKHLPDMLWAKDLNGNYLFANESICKNLLMAKPREVIGKNDVYFATRERNKYSSNKQWHTFGELCFNSDYVVLEYMKPMKFEEYGNIKGKLVYLEVHKAPLYDSKGILIGTIGSGRDITSQIMLKETNKKLAFYDQLTGLPNRQKITIDILKNNPDSCVIFNIDQFKEINDFFGTENGDKILQDIAIWFSKFNFETYRIDGDEFAILFYDNNSIENIELKVKDILNHFEKELFYIEEEKIQVAFSVGIAKVNNNLLTKADIAVHYSKEQKSKISIYKEDGNIEQKYKQNIAMATNIREALNDKRIICHYQPILDQRTGKIFKYETLVRMVNKKGEIIPPIEFLEISKKTKLYTYITREVLHQACNTFKNRKENFSINLSIDDIKDTNIVNEIIETIIDTKTASRITFEILESEEIENYQEVRNFSKRIKEIGSKIAVDDFGTGYSNFEHILKLNVDYIKIDGSLIKGMENNNKNRIIVETILDFAKKIGAKTIAEFVYNEATYLITKEIGIDYLQGFYIGKASENIIEF